MTIDFIGLKLYAVKVIFAERWSGIMGKQFLVSGTFYYYFTQVRYADRIQRAQRTGYTWGSKQDC